MARNIRVVRLVAASLLAALATTTAWAHPGSGIVADAQGNVYFVDTGIGVWKIDPQGRVARHPGPAYHFLAIDRLGRLTQRDLPGTADEDLKLVGEKPALIVASSYPPTVGPAGDFYYPQPGDDDHVRIMRVSPPAHPAVFATLPVAKEIGFDGKTVVAQWIHGLAAASDGSLYYSERHAVRRVAPDGTVSTVADHVTVPDCERPPLAPEERLGPSLRGLDVAADGAVYVAASSCSAVLKIAPAGDISVVLRATDAWSPTGVVLSGDDLYVLEYLHIAATRREAWLPRVRKVSADGTVSLVCSIER